jgi:hypothetical protein
MRSCKHDGKRFALIDKVPLTSGFPATLGYLRAACTHLRRVPVAGPTLTEEPGTTFQLRARGSLAMPSIDAHRPRTFSSRPKNTAANVTVPIESGAFSRSREPGPVLMRSGGKSCLLRPGIQGRTRRRRKNMMRTKMAFVPTNLFSFGFDVLFGIDRAWRCRWRRARRCWPGGSCGW